MTWCQNPPACAQTCSGPKIAARPRQVFRDSAFIPLPPTFVSSFAYSYWKGLMSPEGLFMNLAEFIDGQRDQHLAELCEFLRIPSVSAKSEHKPDIERGARWVADNLRAAGFKTVEIIPTNLHPLVYAESLEASGKPTILFYCHYDVQPAEPLDLWTSPAFGPPVRKGNLFVGRSAHIKALA